MRVCFYIQYVSVHSSVYFSSDTGSLFTHIFCGSGASDSYNLNVPSDAFHCVFLL